MASNSLAERRRNRRQRQQVKESSSEEEEIEKMELDGIPSSSGRHDSMATSIAILEQENEIIDESPLVKIIEGKQRKDWAKLVAPVDEDQIKKKRESMIEKFSKLFSKIPSPIKLLLDRIEHRHGYTIRSYFRFIVWLFYLNVFTFIICFLCIIMPTYIYPNTNFSSYAMNEYCQINHLNILNQSCEQCTLTDPQCKILNEPLSNNMNDTSGTCMNNLFTASSCCSLHTEAFFFNSSRESESEWTKFLSDLIDGTGFFTLNRLFIGYYQNLTKPDNEKTYIQTYNMGLAVFLTTFACLLFAGIIIIRKYGDGMKKSYVQSESFENDLFQYIFARCDYRNNDRTITQRHEQRFQTEIKNILFERSDKINFKFDRAIDKIIFQVQRIVVWIITLIIFAGAIAILYFTNRFSFQEKAKKEMNDGVTESSRVRDMAIEYLPSAVVSGINILSQLIFAYMRDLKLYTRTTAVRHYLLRVIIMRLLLLFTFIFIVILQITCNSNQCGRQSELIDCAEIKGQATFIHCWETVIGQVIYRLIIIDTAVMIAIHLIVDPLQSLLRRYCCCCCSSSVGEVDGTSLQTQAKSKTGSLLKPLEFELGDYVLDLTYGQTLCWHGLLFCPFISLIAAAKNILIFAIKLLSLTCFRKRSGLELSPARARHIFTAVLLFSFVCALLPITFLATSLRPSRGCGPFRLYSHEPEFYIYYSVRNIFSQIPNTILVSIIFKLTSAVVIIPLVLILILFSCILTIQRNSYRGASVELYKLLYTSRKTHQLAVRKAQNVITSVKL